MHIFSFFSIIAWIIFLYIRYPKYASIFPFFTTCSIIISLYSSALLGVLFITSKLIFIVGFSLIGYQIHKNKRKISFFKKYFTNLPLGYYFFFLSGIFWYFFTYQASLYIWDEFFWGQFIKVIHNTNALYGTKSAILDYKINYPPGVPLWQYYFLQTNKYLESALYFSQGIIVFSSISILFNLVENKLKKTVVTFIAVVFAISYFAPDLLSILVDHLLGLVFAAAMISSFFLLKSNSSKLLLIPALFTLPLIKSTGLVLSFTIIISLILELIFRRLYSWQRTKNIKINYKTILIVIFLILTPFLSVKSWDWYLSSQGIVSNTSIISMDQVIRTFSNNKNQREIKTIDNFNKAVFSFDSYYLQWNLFFLFSLLLIVIMLPSKHKFRMLALFIGLMLGLVFYNFLILLIYLFIFSEYEGLQLSSMSRYMNTYYLASILIVVSSVLYLIKNSKAKVFIPVNKVFTLCLILLFVVFKPGVKSLFTNPQIKASTTNEVKNAVSPIINLVNNQTEKNSKVWLIYQNSTGFEAMIIRYEIVPRRMNSWFWSLGNLYSKEDVWTTPLSETEWSNELIKGEYDYLVLGRVDDNFWKYYNSLFKDLEESKTCSIFSIKKEKNNLEFIPEYCNS